MTPVSDQVHVWYRCHGCDAAPIVGVRHHCHSCPEGPDNSLCQRCYESYRSGSLAHPKPDSAFAHLTLPTHEFREYAGTSREGCAAWARVPDTVCAAPAVPDRFVFRPEFSRGDVSTIGPYAFALEAPPWRLVVTALHVLHELAVVAAHVPAGGPCLVDRVELYDVFAPRWMFARVGSAGEMLVLPLAGTDDEEPYCQRDIAAFAVSEGGQGRHGSPFTHVPLASRRPDVGDPLWLAANTDTSARVRAAVVVESSERALIFRFADSTPTRRATSGAPLIDRHGHVAGINIGGGDLDGRELGHALHADSLRGQLAAASRPTPTPIAASSRHAPAPRASA